jgi:hypothetical protein
LVSFEIMFVSVATLGHNVTQIRHTSHGIFITALWQLTALF